MATLTLQSQVALSSVLLSCRLCIVFREIIVYQIDFDLVNFGRIRLIMNLSRNNLTSLKILVIYIQICINQQAWTLELLINLWWRSDFSSIFRGAIGWLGLIVYPITTNLIVFL